MRRTIAKALILSAVMLMTCLSVLFASTYTWFIDSESSVDNTVMSGTLDVSLTAKAADGNDINLAEDKIVNEMNWQPSDKNAVALTITNNGSIDIKFDLNLTVVDPAPATDLSPAIWYVFTPDADLPTAINPYTPCDEPAVPVLLSAFTPVSGVTLAAGASTTYRLDYGFLCAAGNEYQNGTLNVTVNVGAYQTMN